MCSAGSFRVDKFIGVLGRSGCRTCSSSYEIYSSYTCPSGYQLSGIQCKVFINNATTAANSTSSDRTLTFVYGPEHQRIQQVVALSANAPAALQSGAGTTYYLNGEDGQGLSYEKEVKANGITEYKHYLAAGGMVFAMQVSRSGTLSAGNPAIGGNQASSLRYLHHDHLGSVAAVTDGTTGTVIERLAFDPWGKRRNVNGQADVTDSLVGQTTDRGYTEHEHLDEMGIIHMNGRVYDPLVGRMMSADPFIQAPGSLQSYNRYSYVMNNPLNLTDPSGYRSIFQKLMHLGDRISSIGVSLGSPKLYHASVNFLSGPGGYTLKSAALSYVSTYCVWASVCNGAFQSALAKGYGASDRDAFKAGAIGFVSSELNDMAGGVGAKYGQYSTEHYLAHAAAGCITTVAGGGKCGQGVVSGVIGLGVTEATGGDNWNKVTRGIAVSVSGGVSSVILGGSFENGARTAAYGYLFNHLGDHSKGKSSFWDGAKDGLTSYTDGLAEVAVQRMALSGAFGETAMQQAQGYASSVSDALDWAAQNPKAIAQGLYSLTVSISVEETRYIQAKMGARVGFGSFVSVGTFGVGAVLVPTAAYGNMLEAAKKGASRIEIIKRGGVGY